MSNKNIKFTAATKSRGFRWDAAKRAASLMKIKRDATLLLNPSEEFIYLLERCLIYQHGNSEYEMEAGDSIVFDGKIPHSSLKLLAVPIKLLSGIHYNEEG